MGNSQALGARSTGHDVRVFFKPDLSGKRAIVTVRVTSRRLARARVIGALCSLRPCSLFVHQGANSGIGYDTARQLALAGCEVILAVRRRLFFRIPPLLARHLSLPLSPHTLSLAHLHCWHWQGS